MSYLYNIIFVAILSFSPCENFREGFFKFENKHSDVIIYRHNDYQIEYNIHNDEWVVVKIRWLSDCQYSFQYYRTNIKALQKHIGDIISTTIYPLDYNKYYYRSIYSEENQYFEGNISLCKNIKIKYQNIIKNKLLDVMSLAPLQKQKNK